MNALSLPYAALPVPARLEDGRVVLIRALSPADEQRLCRFYKRLSPETVYRRFMVANPTLGGRQMHHLLNLDHVDREALVAMLYGEIHAVARYHRAPGSREAEIAVVVEDRWQRRGLGRLLCTRLAGLARSRGIDAFSGTMLADNMRATKLLQSVFPNADRSIKQGELVFHIPLQEQNAFLRPA